MVIGGSKEGITFIHWSKN